ncbi:hypothetical protein C8R47DRAFT_1141931 [Mycena vitilis]|nr:hypothetical protein C8R47DRAFT_1141931 [Mycena vitilis]
MSQDGRNGLRGDTCGEHGRSQTSHRRHRLHQPEWQSGCVDARRISIARVHNVDAVPVRGLSQVAQRVGGLRCGLVGRVQQETIAKRRARRVDDVRCGCRRKKVDSARGHCGATRLGRVDCGLASPVPVRVGGVVILDDLTRQALARISGALAPSFCRAHRAFQRAKGRHRSARQKTRPRHGPYGWWEGLTAGCVLAYARLSPTEERLDSPGE